MEMNHDSKTDIVHFCCKKTPKTVYNYFYYDNTELTLVSEYKYFDVIFDEFIKVDKSSKTVADSGGRALGALWAKFKGMRDVGFNTYTTLYNTGVVSVLDYDNAIWGFQNTNQCEILQTKTIRYFLVVHNFTAVPALQIGNGLASM